MGGDGGGEGDCVERREEKTGPDVPLVCSGVLCLSLLFPRETNGRNVALRATDSITHPHTHTHRYSYMSTVVRTFR